MPSPIFRKGVLFTVTAVTQAIYRFNNKEIILQLINFQKEPPNLSVSFIGFSQPDQCPDLFKTILRAITLEVNCRFQRKIGKNLTER